MSEPASAYSTVVGTDGSESSLRAVARGHLPSEGDAREPARAQDVLGEEAHQVAGSHPPEDTVRTAAGRAGAAGAAKVRTVAVLGSPVETLLDVVRRDDADLLVVGNRGLNSIKGRLLGSVPADATRRAQCDVLVVHTTD